MSADSFIAIDKWMIHDQAIGETRRFLLNGWIRGESLKLLEWSRKSGFQQSLIS